MFVTASVFQFASNLLEVLITLSICTLLVITSALPTPTAVMSCAFVTKSFILLNASERSACMVNELVVTDPTKNLEPLSTGPPSPTVLNNSLALEPSLNDSIRIASPVVSP